MSEPHIETDACGDCGNDHPTVESTTKKLTRQYRIMVAGYFTSLTGLAVAAYFTFGFGGAGMVVGGFFSYFAHLNMKVASQHLDMLDQLKGGGEGKSLLDSLPKPPTGQYL